MLLIGLLSHFVPDSEIAASGPEHEQAALMDEPKPFGRCHDKPEYTITPYGEWFMSHLAELDG